MQIINQFPTFPYLPIASVIEIWIRDWLQYCPRYCVCNQTHNPPKKPLPGGEEISLGDLAIPPTLTEIQKQVPKKQLLSHSQWTTGEKFE